MIKLDDIQKAAQSAVDVQGNPVVQIPRELGDEWLAQQPKSIQELRPENQRALALLDEWKLERSGKVLADRIREALAEWDAIANELSDEWWDQFQQFLKDNRFDLSR